MVVAAARGRWARGAASVAVGPRLASGAIPHAPRSARRSSRPRPLGGLVLPLLDQVPSLPVAPRPNLGLNSGYSVAKGQPRQPFVGQLPHALPLTRSPMPNMGQSSHSFDGQLLQLLRLAAALRMEPVVEMSCDWPPPSAYKNPSFPTKARLEIIRRHHLGPFLLQSHKLVPGHEMNARHGTRAYGLRNRLFVFTFLVEDPSAAVVVGHLERVEGAMPAHNVQPTHVASST